MIKMKIKSLDFIDKLANDRVKEKIETLKNNNFIIDYMIKNNIKDFCGNTIEDLREKNKRLEEYIKITSM